MEPNQENNSRDKVVRTDKLSVDREKTEEESPNSNVPLSIGNRACRMLEGKATIVHVQVDPVRIYQRPNYPHVPYPTPEQMENVERAYRVIRQEAEDRRDGIERSRRQLGNILRSQPELLPTGISVLVDMIQAEIDVRRRFAERAVMNAVEDGALQLVDEINRVVALPEHCSPSD